MVWQSYFPFREWRQAQAEGLDFICRALTETDDVFLEAPTGVGKSAMAIALARYSAAIANVGTYISTTSISLEDQYMKDFAELGLRQLHAKSHYPCSCWSTCDVGSRCHCKQEEPCSYKVARAEFDLAPFSIANAAFLCTCARFVPSWAPREIAVFDEAHLLHDTVADGYSFNIYADEVEFFPPEGAEPAWLKSKYDFWLNTKIDELQRQLDAETSRLGKIGRISDQDIQRLCRKLERAEHKQTNLSRILADDPANWIFDQQPDRLAISPLWATSLAATLLPRIGTKRIYLSATLPGFTHQARYLGIDPNKARFLALPSPFPVEHRLVHVCPVVKWDYRDQGPAIARTCRALEKILDLFPNDRGLVHVSSYWQAQQIVQQCRNPWKKRLLTHDNAREKDVRLDEMFARPGTVLISPSSHEGLDLFGDRSRFQVIAKLPFASLGDKRVKKRMEVDPSWYTLHTAQKLIQAAGRSIRSDTDYATTVILDAAFERFAGRAWDFFPEYFRDALREKEITV